MARVDVIGAGLAGSEAAYYLLKHGFEVHLFDARPMYQDGAHETEYFGELVCSNSLKSKRLDNACGLLKEEMRRLGSIMMEASVPSEVPAGNALSVDRELFGKFITEKLLSFPNLHFHKEEITQIPLDVPVILATGPLTSPALSEWLTALVGQKNLSFFDASAPIVKKDSIDFSKAYFKSRYEQGDESYINCPFTKEEYFAFVKELIHADKALLHEFDTHYFEGCLPVEVIASRGMETLRHGPLKPFGLETPEYPKPYAVAQLRQDTKLGDYYNIVGFQTNLTYPEQKRVFSMIPGLENAEFLRYGLMHRNSYINAPLLLHDDLSLKAAPNVYVAGQLSGVEGYVESAAMGILAAIHCARKIQGKPFEKIPRMTVYGGLVSYLLHASPASFAPMNANWALLPGAKKENREAMIENSLREIDAFIQRVER
ncbi:MAG: methylenetetrahydrofolate--tRNA-(uracil(54)-C(5))-methyltransferase (FADH(2)-oxidizing) TrmFO [Candidatus Enteromonas sp.]|nr:methylenetetrahydrofolate--tRNA-(uracil(54)-C(5))-methyltransferase (FADH(2)-oxidizing) TrmFO [Candidatus Enteromonas sp.]